MGKKTRQAEEKWEDIREWTGPEFAKPQMVSGEQIKMEETDRVKSSVVVIKDPRGLGTSEKGERKVADARSTRRGRIQQNNCILHRTKQNTAVWRTMTYLLLVSPETQHCNLTHQNQNRVDSFLA